MDYHNIRNSTYMGSYIPFKIEKNDILEIHFVNSPHTLEHLFEMDFGRFDETLFAPFLDDKNIISVDFSHFNSSLVRSMESMFYGANPIEEINFSNFDTSKVNNMNHMFEFCSSLSSLNLSNFDTSNVEVMWRMFDGCTSLKSLDLSNFDTSNVVIMWSMFDGCTSLKSLDLSNFDTSGVTNMEAMFYNCISLQFLDISNFNTEYLRSSDVIFDNLNSLKYLNLYNIDDTGLYIDNKNKYESLIEIPNLIICKKEGNIGINNAINICDDNKYYSYPAINYVTITYEDDKYNQTFKKENEYFMIGLDNKLELHFNYLLTDNYYIFKCSSIQIIDKKNITSYDFSHFDSSKMTNMHSMSVIPLNLLI